MQQAWVARYNNGILNGTNQAVKIALDSIGNIYVLGFSQNTNTNLGYVCIKYAPNGNRIWAARYDSTNFPSATPSGFALDLSNNVVVTGNALTLKYGPNGNQLWTAPYDGAAVAMDAGGNSMVTGFSSAFDTVKISPNGTNLWSTSYIEPNGPVVSQAVVVDSGGNSYVAGSDTYDCFYEGPNVTCVNGLLLVKYDQNGTQAWKSTVPVASVPAVQVAGMARDSSNNIYLVADGTGPGSAFQTFSYSNDGILAWTAFPDNGIGPASGLALDGNANVLLVGQDPYELSPYGPYGYYYTTF
jgi:hypothetical protein